MSFWLQYLIIYSFKCFTGHWQKPVCGRISDGWRKRRKWKLKNCFHFPPLFFLFSSLFLTASSYDPRSSISIMLKIITRTTHTIFDELLNRSQNKKLLATTTTHNKNWKTKWKNLMSALKKKHKEKNLPRYTKKLIFFYLTIFPFTLK